MSWWSTVPDAKTGKTYTPPKGVTNKGRYSTGGGDTTPITIPAPTKPLKKPSYSPSYSPSWDAIETIIKPKKETEKIMGIQPVGEVGGDTKAPVMDADAKAGFWGETSGGYMEVEDETSAMQKGWDAAIQAYKNLYGLGGKAPLEPLIGPLLKSTLPAINILDPTYKVIIDAGESGYDTGQKIKPAVDAVKKTVVDVSSGNYWDGATGFLEKMTTPLLILGAILIGSKLIK